MKPIVWIASGCAALIAVGYGLFENRTRALEPVEATLDATAATLPQVAERIGVAYRSAGDDAFSDVAVATVEPFDANGDGQADGGVLRLVSQSGAQGSLVKGDVAPFAHAETSLSDARAVQVLNALAAAGDAQAAALQVADVAPSDEANDVSPTGSVGDQAGSDAADDLPPEVDPILSSWQSTHFTGNPLVGTVFASDGQSANEDDLMQAAEGARYLLLGESHDNPDHHRIQANILGGLAKLGKKPSVVLEMVPERLAERLAAFKLDDDGDLAKLAADLDWTGRGWPDFSIYKPLFEAALSAGMPLKAGDLDETTVAAIARKGMNGLGASQAERLHLTRPASAEDEKALADSIREAHCNLLPEKAIAPMALAQRARDGALADAMTTASEETGSAVLIAGSGHVRNDRGVPALIAATEPTAKSVSVRMVEVAGNEKTPAFYGLDADAPAPYDFTIFTPRQNVGDPCVALRGRGSATQQ